MADLDTAAKRLSGIHPSCPWRGLFPIPDGTIAQPDRQVIAWLYSAIEAGVPVIPTPTPSTPALGVRRARFLRRGPKLPWEEDEQVVAKQQEVVVQKSIRRRIKLPKEVVKALDGDVPVQTHIQIDAPSIRVPDIGTAKLVVSTDEEEAVILAII